MSVCSDAVLDTRGFLTADLGTHQPESRQPVSPVRSPRSVERIGLRVGLGFDSHRGFGLRVLVPQRLTIPVLQGREDLMPFGMPARQLPERTSLRPVAPKHLEHRLGPPSLDRLLRRSAQAAERLVVFVAPEDRQPRPFIGEPELQWKLGFRSSQQLIGCDYALPGGLVGLLSELAVQRLGATETRQRSSGARRDHLHASGSLQRRRRQRLDLGDRVDASEVEGSGDRDSGSPVHRGFLEESA